MYSSMYKNQYHTRATLDDTAKYLLLRLANVLVEHDIVDECEFADKLQVALQQVQNNNTYERNNPLVCANSTTACNTAVLDLFADCFERMFEKQADDNAAEFE